MSISERLNRIREEVGDGVVVIAVSKRQSQNAILEAYSTGQRVFGENQFQELIKKNEDLPKDIEWHYIGNLQTKMIKKIVPIVTLIHSVSSLKHCEKINLEAAKCSRKIDILLQIKIAQEESKGGVTEAEAIELIKSIDIAKFEAIRIVGVMGMATKSNSESVVRDEFKKLKSMALIIKSELGYGDADPFTISMGMSGDYKLAVQEGSTMLRLGTTIFGDREY